LPRLVYLAFVPREKESVSAGPQSHPKVSVVIPHYRDAENLKICLAALAAQSYPRASFEIIVADNGSPDAEAVKAAAAMGGARLVIAQERGAGPARNAGAAAAQGEILAFVDSDCVPEPQWLAEGVAALSRFDFAGGRVTVLIADPSRMTAVEAFEKVFAFDNEAYVTKKGFTGSGNLFCPRALFEKVGGFRVGVSEDVEWSHRATAGGFRLGFAPNATVDHPARRTWSELAAKWKRLTLEAYLLAMEKGGKLRWFLRSLLLPPSALAHTPRVLRDPSLGMDRKLAATGVLFAIRCWRFGECLRLLLFPRR
jgi:glycosyltransferase involved in cell wall biosynthesis